MGDGRAAVVVGGGIGGLAASASLLRHGWEVTILERAPRFGEIGAGLAVTANGMAALDAIGSGDAVRAAGHRLASLTYRNGRGRRLAALPVTPATTAVGIHRRRLHDALLAAVAGAHLVAGAEVVGVDPGDAGGARAGVRWRDAVGELRREADLVVGADGLRSAVRSVLWPGSGPSYSGATCWRAVVDDTAGTLPVDDGFTTFWGAGADAGVLSTGRDGVYWYLYLLHPPGATFDDELGTARRAVDGWAPELTELVAATDPSNLVRHDVFHVAPPLPSYVRGRVALAGDAAHALVPTMGQGANTALEDGVTLGPLLRGADLAAGLRAYDTARRPRTQRIARRSLQVQRMGADLVGRWPRAVRDALLRLTPPGPMARAGARDITWTPP
ncbi:FAD-dependent monooxygenase [Pseudonocardia endophytica]|uniref:2-polyprenyl-6-methoxyphenol hydroxylase-like FAD-dependent oxidoreductase n=1 Tax=Pseudonocardia endophytica TaxID=401976 RepID=A0A4R1HZC2_PSEEN|nr:FAD-dependent monooxygenase [Pseudonocardia endophytica]TCK26933.1 2-polyprenyl-6-methoxyphenol hydroxylase-like FAD-dependent oxidoreductase [Pseudonocardia endophytica]